MASPYSQSEFSRAALRIKLQRIVDVPAMPRRQENIQELVIQPDRRPETQDQHEQERRPGTSRVKVRQVHCECLS